MKYLLALIKDKEGLCALAFLLALVSIFESTLMHGLEFLQKVGVFSTATAAEKEVPHE